MYGIYGKCMVNAGKYYHTWSIWEQSSFEKAPFMLNIAWPVLPTRLADAPGKLAKNFQCFLVLNREANHAELFVYGGGKKGGTWNEKQQAGYDMI